MWTAAVVQFCLYADPLSRFARYRLVDDASLIVSMEVLECSLINRPSDKFPLCISLLSIEGRWLHKKIEGRWLRSIYIKRERERERERERKPFTMHACLNLQMEAQTRARSRSRQPSQSAPHREPGPRRPNVFPKFWMKCNCGNDSWHVDADFGLVCNNAECWSTIPLSGRCKNEILGVD